MSDENLVKRLRERIDYNYYNRDGEDAADAIERLTRERDKLREALKPFAEEADGIEGDFKALPDNAISGGAFSLGDLRRARAVLDKIKGGGDE